MFFSKNTNGNTKEKVSAELGIPSTKDLGKYLGLPTINAGSQNILFMLFLKELTSG